MSKHHRHHPDSSGSPIFSVEPIFQGDFSQQAEDDLAVEEVLGDQCLHQGQTSDMPDPRPLITPED